MSVFITKNDDALLISVTSVLSILNTTFPVPSSMITQVAEHVIAQANVLWILRWWTTLKLDVRGDETDNPSVIFYPPQQLWPIELNERI